MGAVGASKLKTIELQRQQEVDQTDRSLWRALDDENPTALRIKKCAERCEGEKVTA